MLTRVGALGRVLLRELVLKEPSLLGLGEPNPPPADEPRSQHGETDFDAGFDADFAPKSRRGSWGLSGSFSERSVQRSADASAPDAALCAVDVVHCDMMWTCCSVACDKKLRPASRGRDAWSRDVQRAIDFYIWVKFALLP